MSYLFLILILHHSNALNNGVGLTPPMGWTTRNTMNCDNLTDSNIEGFVLDMINDDLSAYGYRYVIVDDCWSAKNRTSTGLLEGDPVRFPNGINYTGYFINAMGLKFGLYADAGEFTCLGCPGSLGHEASDAAQFASWGVDYLKYDNCYNESLPAPPRYAAMRDALNQTGRPIFYNLCTYGQANPWAWGPATGNSWRTTPNTKFAWNSVMINFYQTTQYLSTSAPGAWNDPDVLLVGCGVLTENEEITQFTLWAVIKAPLIIGCNVMGINSISRAILEWLNVIRINQDSLGEPATCRSGCDYKTYLIGGEPNVFFGALSKGEFVITITNWGTTPMNASIALKDYGINGIATVFDLWGENIPQMIDIIQINQLAKHSIKAYRIIP
jgi:alpha-galactosidase